MTAPEQAITATDAARSRDTGGVRNLIAIGAVVALIVVLALGFRNDPRDIRSAAVGKPAPAFELASLEGGPAVSLAAMRGKVVVVNFFASWCVPCRQEHPALARAWERYRLSDVVLVGIVYQDSVDSARAFTQRLGTAWPTAIDDRGRTALGFGVYGVPETFFIDRSGVIQGRHFGPIDEETLIRGIETLRRTPP